MLGPLEQAGEGVVAGVAGGANSVPRAELGRGLLPDAFRPVLEGGVLGEFPPVPQKGMSGRVEVAGTAILYLVIMESDKKRMMKEAYRMHREHIKRFHAKPRKVVWESKWG